MGQNLLEVRGVVVGEVVLVVVGLVAVDIGGGEHN
jgi:hypothetical protein